MSGDHDREAAGGHRRAPGQLEGAVLAALWSADGPMTAAQVKQAIAGDLAYTTVLTILSRLYDKGTLTRRRTGRSFAYAPVKDEAAHTAELMQSLLEGGSDRAAVLSRFVSQLSAADEQLLLQLISDHLDE